MILCNIKKDKNLLMFEFEDGRTATYDFIKRVSIGVSNREILAYSLGKYLFNTTQELEENPLYLILRGIFELSRNPYVILSEVEQWLSYIDLLDNSINYPADYVDFLTTTKIQKGYISWLRQNNKKINRKSLSEFRNYNIAKQLKGDLKQNFQIINILTHEQFHLGCFYQLSRTMQANLIKSIKIDFKNFCIPKHAILLEYLVTELSNDIEKYYDSNRGIDHNVKILQEISNKIRNEKIIKNETKIFDLEKLEIDDDLQIIVPHSIDDFTIEGKQQNNCVGSHYHNSIANGQNLIYFIRKKENINNSYITCRYNTSWEETVETRLKNNITYANKVLFEKIDTEIKKLLSL